MADTLHAPTKAEPETIQELDTWFRQAVDHPITRTWQEEADYAFQMYEGRQWTAEEVAELTHRGQPPIVENEIKPIVERLKGTFRRQRTTVKFVGRNQPDDGLASTLSDLLRFVDQTNEYEFTEGEIVENGFVGGRGVLEVCVEPSLTEGKRIVLAWEDPFCIFPDPFSRAFDWNLDARYLHRAKWMDYDEALMRWPTKAMEIRQCAALGDPGLSARSFIDPAINQKRSMDVYYDHERRRLRPVETWYKRRVKRRILATAEGTQIDVTPLSARQAEGLADQTGAVLHEETGTEMWVAVWCNGLFLEEPKRSPYRHDRFPFVQYRAYAKHDGTPYGYVKGLIDPQREINARRSKALHAINNRQTIFEESAIADKNSLADELAKVDGQIEVRPGKFDRFVIRENQDISQGNLAMLQEAKVAMRRISGEDQLNPAPEVRSGTGIQRLQMIHQAGVLTLYDNIRRFRRLKAELVYALIRQYYTQEMVFAVTDDPGVTRQVQISASQFETLRQRDYDLIVADTHDYLTAQSEQFDMLTTVLPQILPFGAQWAALMIQMSDLRNKEGILQLLQGMTAPPPVEPKLSVALQWNELTPQQQMAWAERFGMPSLMQAVAQNPQMPANLVQNQAEMMKVAMKNEMELKKAGMDSLTTLHEGEQNRQSERMKEAKEARRERVSDKARPR